MTFELIEQAVAPSGGLSTFTFNNIPQTFTELHLRASLRISTSAGFYFDVELDVNGESARKWTGMYGLSGSTAASTNSTFNLIGGANAPGSTANAFSMIEFWLPNYTNTTVKTGISRSSVPNASTSQLLSVNINDFTNSAAVTSITIKCSTNPFAEHSSVGLYGLASGTESGVTTSP